MNPFSADVRKHSIILLLRNLPKDMSEEHLSAFLWQRLGINIPSENLSIKPLEDSANCLAVITRPALADFMSRALERETIDNRQIQVHQSAPRTSPTEG